MEGAIAERQVAKRQVQSLGLRAVKCFARKEEGTQAAYIGLRAGKDRQEENQTHIACQSCKWMVQADEIERRNP